MRLIDADSICGCGKYIKTNEKFEPYIMIDDLVKLLDEQPTAYDIDKVVEKLEERTDFLKDCTKYGNKNAKQQAESYRTMMMYEVADLVDDLIEIVKQGGVSDDVCEWNAKSNYYVTECSHDTDVMYGLKQDFKFCPYCGKKIKAVE